MNYNLIKTVFIFFCLIIVTVSCSKIAMRQELQFYDKAKVKYISDGNKTVAYISMIHMNKPAFYESVKNKVDSLRSAGYTIFYETVAITHPIDSLAEDTLNRKFRKVVGMHISDYSDKDNKAMKKFQLQGLVAQSHVNTGIIPGKDIKADLPQDSLIQIYEKHRGKIFLDECDFTTPLNEKYKCHKANNSEAVFLVLTIRNQLIAKRILFEDNDKIAVVYGALHYNGIIRELKAYNPEWNYIDYR